MLIEPLRYDNAHDVEMRLYDTVIRYKDEPYHVGMTKNLNVCLFSLQTGGYREEVHSSDSDLDISSPPLGFVNVIDTVYYAARRPLREQAQGLKISRMTLFRDGVYQGKSGLPKKTLYRCIKGIYPSFEESLQELKDNPDRDGYAFSRHLAVYRTKDEKVFRVSHLLDNVGIYFKDEGIKFFSTQDSEYLRKKISSHMEIL